MIMHTDLQALQLGYTLNEYSIARVLGAGEFSITYLVLDTHLRRWNVLKEYLPRCAAVREAGAAVRLLEGWDREKFAEGMDLFLAEVQTLAQLQHPNLMGVVRYFKANWTAYIVMDYVEGEVLTSYIASEAPLSESVLRGILEPIMDGLLQVHEAGYLHGNITPDNIILRGDASPVILPGPAPQRLRRIINPTDDIIHKEPYVPLELYDASRQGPYTDIYALGMVAYRCISGVRDSELPEAPERLFERHRGGDDLAPAVEVGKGRYGLELLKAIDWAIEMYEESRPQGVEAWREALLGAGGHRMG